MSTEWKQIVSVIERACAPGGLEKRRAELDTEIRAFVREQRHAGVRLLWELCGLLEQRGASAVRDAVVATLLALIDTVDGAINRRDGLAKGPSAQDRAQRFLGTSPFTHAPKQG